MKQLLLFIALLLATAGAQAQTEAARSWINKLQTVRPVTAELHRGIDSVIINAIDSALARAGQGGGTVDMSAVALAIRDSLGRYFDSTQVKSLIAAGSQGGKSFKSFQLTSDGSTTLTLPEAYLSGSVQPYRNGIRIAASGFTEATVTTLLLSTAPDAGDIITVDYSVAATGAAATFAGEDFTSAGSTTLTLAHAYKAGTVRAFRNGIRVSSTEATATTITLTNTPDTGDIITVYYQY